MADETLTLATRLLEEYAGAWRKISELALSLVTAQAQGRTISIDVAEAMIVSVLQEFVVRVSDLFDAFNFDNSVLKHFLSAVVNQASGVSADMASCLRTEDTGGEIDG